MKAEYKITNKQKLSEPKRTYYSSERQLTITSLRRHQHAYVNDNLYYVMKLDNNGILSYYILHSWNTQWFWLQIPFDDNKIVEYLLPILGYKEAELSSLTEALFDSLKFKRSSLDTQLFDKPPKNESFQFVCRQIIKENLKLI